MEVMLTTIDNPYNPFTQFDEWYRFDESSGYHTCGYLNRIANTSPDMDDLEESMILEEAMDEIIRINPLKIYKKVFKENKINKISGDTGGGY